jgi:2-phospho-L-lactate guanylyltransferase
MARNAQDVLAWSLVVPVKVLAQAKSRLTGLAGADKARLALAMAADTVAAAIEATGVAAVLVVTDDREVGDAAARLGAIVLPDVPASGLNEAVGYGAAYARDHWPDRGRAALAGDLPALKADELTTALTTAAGHAAAFVPDADGTGTTLYTATPGADFRPRFGHGSARRHLADGATELQDPGLAGLRRDVDTADDLRRAIALGLGPRTGAVLKCARWDT